MSRQPFAGPSPFQQGHALGAAGEPFRPAPAHWSDRAAGMYASGYEQATAQRARRDAATFERLRPILVDLLAYQAEEFDPPPLFDVVRITSDGERVIYQGFETREEADEAAHADNALSDETERYEVREIPGEERGDLDVSGADLVDAFTAWRGQIKAALEGEG